MRRLFRGVETHSGKKKVVRSRRKDTEECERKFLGRGVNLAEQKYLFAVSPLPPKHIWAVG